MVEGVKTPQRGPDQSRKAIRVQVPSGSFNACRRRELSRGNARNRARDTGSAIRRTKTDGEKLNDEMGIKPLPVSAIGDGAEQGTSRSEGVGASFCILRLEIVRAHAEGNYAGAGASDIRCRTGP